MKVVLAEKPSVSRDIARVLNADKKMDGYFAGKDYYVTWALGHLITLANPDSYSPELKRWDLRSLPVIPESFLKLVTADKSAARQYSVIKKLFCSKDVTEIVCATDAGREGELIFRYIYEMAECNKPVKRLWVSSQTDQALHQGFAKIKDSKEYDSLYDSARSRAEADWLIGINATRAYTVRFGQKDGVMSVGRVQTPVLKMIVDRYEENQNFVSQTYYEISALIKHKNGEFKGKLINERNERMTDNAKVQLLAEEIKKFPDGTIGDLTKKAKTENPPLLYDLTEMQKDANKKHKFSAEKTLNLLQALYEKHKVLTYPRTSSRYLSADLKPKIKGLLQNLLPLSSYAGHAENLLSKDLKYSKKVFDDSKVTDHHAIIPTDKKANLSALSSDELTIYDMVIRRFLAAFMDECKKELTEIISLFGKFSFVSRGSVIKKIGWREVYVINEQEEEEDESGQLLPVVKKNDPVSQASLDLEDKKTKAPPLYTEAMILAAMETAGKQIEDEEMREAMKECGLGTPATRAQILERLISVQYIIREKNKLIPTPKGKQLIGNIKNEELLSPQLTGDWEKKLNDIRNRIYFRDIFMAEIKDFTRNIINNVKFYNINQSAAKASTEKPSAAKSFGICPLCGGNIVETKKAYGCSNWNEKSCAFVIWKTIAGKALEVQHVQQLVENKITGKIQGFISKKGSKFDAVLVLNQGKVEFRF